MKCSILVGSYIYYVSTGDQYDDNFHLDLRRGGYTSSHIYDYPNLITLGINEKNELLAILLKFRLNYPNSSFGEDAYTEVSRIVNGTALFEVMP
jgi:hypothetical protein